MLPRRGIGVVLLVGWGCLIGQAAGRSPSVPSRAHPGAQDDAGMARLLTEGDAAFESGQFQAAIQAYIRISPVEIPVPAQNRLAISYHLLQMWDEAEAIYRVATLRDREYAPVASNLGALYYAEGDYKNAENRFRDSLELEPGNLTAQLNLHAARYARENEGEVRRYLAETIAEDPLLVSGTEGEYLAVQLLVDPDTREELRLLALRGDIFVARKMFEDAILEFERYLEVDEYDAIVRNKLGITYQQVQRPSDAEDEYRRALRLNPYYVPALNNLGSVEQARGNYLRALDYYREALEIEPDSSTVLQNLGACLFAMERYEEGLVAYIRAVQLDPSLFDRLEGRGGTLVQVTPGNEAMTSYYLAKLFARNGDADRAMSLLYRAVEEGFSDPTLLGDPVFDVLGSDDRFIRLLASMDERP
jgi:tetratricopeptide (TPR) repeat protein